MKADHASRVANLTPDEVEHGARLLIDQSVASIGQSGGITAHTVNQTYNLGTPTPGDSKAAERRLTIRRLRRFHNQRVDKITAESGDPEILGNGVLILHVLPFASEDNEQSSSFDEIARNPTVFAPAGGTVRDHRINYEGMLIGSNNHGLGDPQRAYVMAFRSGAIEALASSLYRGREEQFLILTDIQQMILKGATDYANGLARYGMNAPMGVFVTIAGVQGKELLHQEIEGALWEDLPSGTLAHDRLDFRECVIESLPLETKAYAKVLKPIFDHLANATGLAASPLFDPSGNYTGT